MHKQHRVKWSNDFGWTTCVTPEECGANPRRQDAHGGIIRVDVCKCGMRRVTEMNGRSKNRGHWFLPEVPTNA